MQAIEWEEAFHKPSYVVTRLQLVDFPNPSLLLDLQFLLNEEANDHLRELVNWAD